MSESACSPTHVEALVELHVYDGAVGPCDFNFVEAVLVADLGARHPPPPVDTNAAASALARPGPSSARVTTAAPPMAIAPRAAHRARGLRLDRERLRGVAHGGGPYPGAGRRTRSGT